MARKNRSRSRGIDGHVRRNTHKLRKAIESDLSGVIETLKTAALNGDVQAAKVLLDKVLPSLKPVQLAQPVAGDGDLLERGQAILQAMQKGELSGEVGKQMIDALSAQAKLVEHIEFDQRLQVLEQAQGDE